MVFPAGDFVLLKESWIDNYDKPMRISFDEFLKKRNEAEAAFK